jgi:hypothetical protein
MFESFSSFVVVGRFPGGWYRLISRRLPSAFKPSSTLANRLHLQPSTKDDEEDWDVTSPEEAPAFRDVVPGRLVSGRPFRASGDKPKTQGKPWAKLS